MTIIITDVAFLSCLWFNGLMNPQYQSPQYSGNSLEYLNQISSPKSPRAGFLNKKVLIIVGALALVLTIVIAVLLNQKPTATPSGQVLGYRLIGLNELVTFGGTSSISDSGLSKALAETRVVTLSEQYQISTYISLPATDSKTPVPSDESVAQTVSTLSKAVASGSFNRKYADALIDQIKRVEASLSEIRAESTAQNTIAKIDQDLAQYNALIERLTDY
jgi:hypothetical protein